MKEKRFNDLIQQITDGTYADIRLRLGEDPTELNLNENPDADDSFCLNIKQIRELCNALKQNPTITNVILSGNLMEDEGAIAVASVHTLEKLNVGLNNITVDGAIALLQSKSSLKELDLSNNGITYPLEDETQRQRLLDSMINNKTIENLNLVGSYLSDKFAAELIAKNNTIKSLSLSYNYITSEALKFIGLNSTLEKLYLSYTNITDNVCEYINNNTSLKTLVINNTKIGDVGARILSTHPSLELLSLIDTELTLAGANCFVHSNLTTVDVRGRNLTEPERYIFYKAFAQAREDFLGGSQTSVETDLIGDSSDDTIDDSLFY